MSQKDLAGKVALVTGANTGIGRVTAEALAARGARVLLACRSKEKSQPICDGIVAAGGEAELFSLDLADLQSVRACADAVLARGLPLAQLLHDSHHDEFAALLRAGIASVVRHSSTNQTVKGIVSAGLWKSAQYASRKLLKRIAAS